MAATCRHFSHVLDIGIRDCGTEKLETQALIFEEGEVREWILQCGINTKFWQGIEAREQTFPNLVACNEDCQEFSFIGSLCI